jgi:hypothetical protein
MGFEPAIAVFDPARTVHALDGAATVIGLTTSYAMYYPIIPIFDSIYPELRWASLNKLN